MLACQVVEYPVDDTHATHPQLADEFIAPADSFGYEIDCHGSSQSDTGSSDDFSKWSAVKKLNALYKQYIPLLQNVKDFLGIFEADSDCHHSIARVVRKEAAYPPKLLFCGAIVGGISTLGGLFTGGTLAVQCPAIGTSFGMPYTITMSA